MDTKNDQIILSQQIQEIIGKLIFTLLKNILNRLVLSLLKLIKKNDFQPTTSNFLPEHNTFYNPPVKPYVRPPETLKEK